MAATKLYKFIRFVAMACIRMRPCQSDNVVMHRHRSCLARPHSHHDFITLEPGLSRTNLRTGGFQRDKIVMHARGNSTAFPPLRKLPRSTLQPVAQPLQPATLQPVAQPLQHSTLQLQPATLQPCSQQLCSLHPFNLQMRKGSAALLAEGL